MNNDENRFEQLKKKRLEVLKAIKPICEAFNIKNYDYIIQKTGQTETLVLNGQRIGCSCNSIEAVINEIIGYIFAKIYCKDKWWHFKPHTLKFIRQYWLN